MEHLVRELDGREYGGMTPTKFFTECYTLRSGLVHGSHPRPQGAAIDARTFDLELLVSDLLSLR